MRAQIGTLVIATSAVQLANGFFGTFISLRVAIEDFGATMAGLVLSSYFAGFTLGALLCGRIIERIGHIRAYAAFGGLVVAATAANAALGWAIAMADSARGHRLRLLWDLHHNRELAQRQGPAV
jgi:MFS family permease